ncbi:MAG: prolipoprotein diacylglyceryl transferase [Oscillospiraceae bacterium]|nr:prolipoprotein diacylglyceryl transferase [Oscillospiraceae bacterium]
MEQIAFISGGTFIYWSAIVVGLAAVIAGTSFLALYYHKSRNSVAAGLMIPLSIVSSLILGRLVHWYCRTDSYISFKAAMTDYSWGGYALLGVFAACIFCACVLRLLRISRNLPQMLDCMALSGGAGIAVGRLASFFNSSDRGILMPETVGLPMAYPVTNAVSGVVENRLATFMLQSIVTAVIVLALLIWCGIAALRKKPIRDGDVSLLFLAGYGASQILLDSTRYDSLFLRSNGFVSVVQILGLVALVLAIVLFSVRMVRTRGFKGWFVALWVVIAAALGLAGYMEYHVQRHGDQALFAYSFMSAGLLVAVGMTVVLCCLASTGKKKEETE